LLGKKYQTNTTTLPTSNTTNILHNNGIRDGTRTAAAAPTTRTPTHETNDNPPLEDISYETEISKNTSHGTNNLAANSNTNYFNTLPYHQTNEYNPQACRGTNKAKVSANGNTNSRSNDNTPSRHHGFPPPPCPCWPHATKGSRWSASEASHCFGAQSWQFDCGERQFLAHHRPTPQNIIAMTNQKTRHTSHQQHDPTIAVTALQPAQAEGAAFRQVLCALSKFWNNVKYSYAPWEKPSNLIRLVMENFNSLCVTSGNKKITTINNLCHNFKADMLCGCETQVDWRMVPNSCHFNNLFGVGTETRSAVAHNINERMLTNQYGGCAIMAMNTISAKVQDTGMDGIGCGRWCWIHLGSGPRKTQIVMAYQPSNSSHSSAGMTVKDQQSHYFCTRGNARSPRTIFFKQLIAQLLLWKSIDNDFVLLGNFNKNVYTGRLATRPAADDLNFVELCRKHTGIPIPPTFWSGSAPIDGVFVTPGITYVNAFILPHYGSGGVGDPQCFIINLTLKSVIGTFFPNIVRCAARKFHCTSSRMVNLYNAELTSVCDRHNIFHRMNTVIRHTKFLTKDDLTQLIDSWDGKLMQFMLHSKFFCSKFTMGHIKWSPTVGLWLSRQWLLHRVLLWMIGDDLPDPRNMIRDCLKLNLPDPWTLTYGLYAHRLLSLTRRSSACQRMPLPLDDSICIN
jgi:hypothetical protein